MKRPSLTSTTLGLFQAVLLVALGACGDTTTFSTISVTGVPECGASWLEHPLTVELSSGDSTANDIFAGHSAQPASPPDLNLPDGRREWEVRFGVCGNAMTLDGGTYTCGEVNWYDEQTLEIDTATGSLAIPTPPQSGCIPANAE